MSVVDFPGMALSARISNKIVEELGGKVPANDALRIALLHCVLLLQDSEDADVKNFCTFLLTEFGPLANAFNKHKHRYFGDVEVMRTQLTEGNVTLALPIERLARALGLPVPSEEELDR